jgi:hypothetical protein
MDGRTHDARNIRRSDEHLFSRDCILRPAEEPPLASHLVTLRPLYSHHGIYVGNGRVIHYGGLAHGWRKFLWRTSLMAAASGFNMTHHASIAAKSWHAHARGWANATIGS